MVMGSLLATPTRLWRREEALGHLVPLEVELCEVDPTRPRVEAAQEAMR